MKRALLAAAAAALVAGPVSAAVVSFSFTKALEPTEINQSGALGLFDASLGTLNSVSLTLNGQSVAEVSAENTALQSVSFRVTSVVDLFFSSSLAGLDLSAVFMGLAATSGLQTLGPGASALVAGLSDADSTVLAPSVSLFSVAGGGTFSIGCTSLTGLGITGGGGFVGASFPTRAACGAEIVYDYTPRVVSPTPTPGTLGLLGAAALAAFGMRRRLPTTGH